MLREIIVRNSGRQPAQKVARARGKGSGTSPLGYQCTGGRGHIREYNSRNSY